MPVYNLELLKQICERDNCQIDFSLYDKRENSLRPKYATIIKFICNCGQSHEKTFAYLNLYLGLCSLKRKI